ncbi:MAG: shikimate dehydrogenase [Gammaproteobacteria bacterium]|nr:shikimate dehydrogenase [Gammaproteobacteria bacterium]
MSHQQAPDRYAVMGNPIAHSKSPFIHNEFARQSGQKLVYTAELVALGELPQAVAAFQSSNGKGLNITVPFKQDAFQLAHELSPRAERAGAVNTLVLRGEKNYFGDTTDGAGLLNDLLHNQIKLARQHILLLGAGGAVRGVIEPLLQQNPARLVIANRTASKAVQLATDFADLGTTHGCGFDDLSGDKFDLVINGTSASLQGELPPLPDKLLARESVVYDMMYGVGATPFMAWGATQGAKTLDGLGMLVEQAAESFFIWRGVRPQTRSVIDLVRASLKT